MSYNRIQDKQVHLIISAYLRYVSGRGKTTAWLTLFILDASALCNELFEWQNTRRALSTMLLLVACAHPLVLCFVAPLFVEVQRVPTTC